MSYKPMWSSSRNQLTHFPWSRRNMPFPRETSRATFVYYKMFVNGSPTAESGSTSNHKYAMKIGVKYPSTPDASRTNIG